MIQEVMSSQTPTAVHKAAQCPLGGGLPTANTPFWHAATDSDTMGTCSNTCESDGTNDLSFEQVQRLAERAGGQ